MDCESCLLRSTYVSTFGSQQAQFSAYSYAHIQYAGNLLTFEDAQSINAANLVFQLCKSFWASCMTPFYAMASYTTADVCRT